MDLGGGETGVFAGDVAGGPREVLALEAGAVGLFEGLDAHVHCS